jgi:hypothetical protein
LFKLLKHSSFEKGFFHKARNWQTTKKNQP